MQSRASTAMVPLATIQRTVWALVVAIAAGTRRGGARLILSS